MHSWKQAEATLGGWTGPKRIKEERIPCQPRNFWRVLDVSGSFSQNTISLEETGIILSAISEGHVDESDSLPLFYFIYIF